jgi:hypothetical protein
MLKFNNTNIFTGHIKQILATFNLPVFDVLTVNDKKNSKFLANKIYIINNELQKYTGGE